LNIYIAPLKENFRGAPLIVIFEIEKAFV